MITISVNNKFILAGIATITLLASLYLTYEAKIIAESAGRIACFIILLFIVIIIFSISKGLSDMSSH